MLDITHQGHDIQPLEFRVDRVKAAHEVLEEQLEGLRQAEHRVAGDDERRDLLAAIIDQLALVGGGIAGADWRWTIVGSWR